MDEAVSNWAYCRAFILLKYLVSKYHDPIICFSSDGSTNALKQKQRRVKQKHVGKHKSKTSRSWEH